MSLYEFSRLIYRNLILLAIVPLTIVVTIYFLTKNEPKSYQSKALMYTGLGSGYNIESGSNSKVDYRSVNTDYDNLMSIIKSRHTLEEVGLRLLAKCLLQEAPNKIIARDAFKDLSDLFPTEIRENYVVNGDEEKTFQKLVSAYASNDELITSLLKKKTAFGVETLQSAEVRRIKSSDMVELVFTSYDQGLSKSTLDVLLKVFVNRYREMKESETGDVVAYFEAELKKAKENLNHAEDELTSFRVGSRVINYGEETKALAIKKQNALEEFAIKKMNLKATESALVQLEEKLELRKSVMTNSIALLEKKRELNIATTAVAILMSSNATVEEIAQKQKVENQIKEEIQNMMQNLVGQQTSKEGLTGKQLVTEWLDNLILFNREKVNVELYKQRLIDIDNQYDNFTPMGSNIDRLERQISVFEREYLEVLHGLNQSKLRQQNIELTSNLEILDAPNFPTEPLPSKRKLLIIMGFLVGVFGVIGFSIGAELLDQTLGNPEKASSITGLEIAGGFPVLNEKFITDYEKTIDQLAGQIIGKVILNHKEENVKPKTIMICSVMPTEGKNTIAKILLEGLHKSGLQASLYMPVDNKEPDPEKRIYNYPRLNSITAATKIDELLKYSEANSQDDYHIVVVPGLIQGKVPVQLVETADMTLLVARADKTWSKAHQNELNDLVKITKGVKPMLIINGMKTHHLDQLLGENPIRHSAFINWIKKTAKFEFSGNQFKTTQK